MGLKNDLGKTFGVWYAVLGSHEVAWGQVP